MRMDVKTNTEVDRQCQYYGLEGEGTVGGGDAKPGCVEATCQEHRPPTYKWENVRWKKKCHRTR